MIASGQTLRKLQPVQPFYERTRCNGVTFGVGPAGYDVRIAEDVMLEPGGFSLASTMERFVMPGNLLGIVHDKSTWARRGVACQNTVCEPGWRGHLTLELSNHGKDIVFIEAGTPIAQIIFHLLDHAAEKPYEGKYQDQQAGPQPAIFEPELPLR